MAHYCPLCGEGIADTGHKDETEAVVYTFFLCEHLSHYAPYMVLEYVSKDAKQKAVLVSSSTTEALMREKELYCFLCGSMLNFLLTFHELESEEPYTLCVYECAKHGHLWRVRDEIKKMIFGFFSLREFDALLRLCGTLSHHHIVIPAYRKHHRRLLSQDIL